MKFRHRFNAASFLVFSLSVAALCTSPWQVQAQDVVAKGAVANEAASVESNAWLTYRGNLQRTGVANVNLAAAPNLVWRYSSDIEPNEFNTTPLVVGPATQRRIYFAADNFVVCLDGQTGAQLWRSKRLQRPITSPIALVTGESGDMILAVTSSGQMNALRVSDGGLIWQVPASAPVQNIAPLLIKTSAGERIMLALATGRLVTYTLDGQPDPSWEVRLGSFSASPTATPALSVDGKLLYIPTQDKRLYVVDIPNAKVAYPINLDFGAFVSPLVLDQHLIAVTGTTLLGMKLRTGQTQWRFDVKSTFGSPAAKPGAGTAADTVYIGARNGKFYAINAENGARVWETDLADSVTGVPVVTQGMILVGTRNGLLFGLAPDDGKVLWRYYLNTQRAIAPRDRNTDGTGRAYRGGDNMMPTGFGNPGGAAPAAGGSGGTAGDGDSATRPAVQTYGVSSMPAVVGEAVYVLGDNAALYAFSTRPFDADPPQAISPQLSIPNSAGKPALQRMDSEKPLLVSGRAPIQFVVELRDAGSGVDPDSIQVSLNNQELPKTALSPFSDTSGRLLVTLVESKGRAATSLEDGLYNVVIKARDYRGNEMNYTGNFLVDNTVPSPAAVTRTADNDDTNRVR